MGIAQTTFKYDGSSIKFNVGLGTSSSNAIPQTTSTNTTTSK